MTTLCCMCVCVLCERVWMWVTELFPLCLWSFSHDTRYNCLATNGASQHTPFNILLSTTKLMHKTVTCESHWCLFAWDHKTRSIKFPWNHVMWYKDSPLLLSLCSKVIWGTLSKVCLYEHSKCDVSFLAMFHSEHTTCFTV